MGRKSVLLLMISVILLVWAIPVFAQPETAAAPAQGKSQWLIIASAFGMALAAAGCGYAPCSGTHSARNNGILRRENLNVKANLRSIAAVCHQQRFTG